MNVHTIANVCVNNTITDNFMAHHIIMNNCFNSILISWKDTPPGIKIPPHYSCYCLDDWLISHWLHTGSPYPQINDLKRCNIKSHGKVCSCPHSIISKLLVVSMIPYKEQIKIKWIWKATGVEWEAYEDNHKTIS